MGEQSGKSVPPTKRDAPGPATVGELLDAGMPMRHYSRATGWCEKCETWTLLYRRRLGNHGAPYCEGTGEKPGECEECGDAPAVTEALFNGATRMRLCTGCFGYWEFHGLDVAYEEGEQ